MLEQEPGRTSRINRSAAGWRVLIMPGQRIAGSGCSMRVQASAASRSLICSRATWRPGPSNQVGFADGGIRRQGDGPECDFSVHGRWPEPHRHLRSQARAEPPGRKPLPPSFKPVITPMGEGRAPLLASKRKWKQHGQSGIWVSDWLPHIATCADDLAVIQSCWSNGLNHVGGVCQMNTGSTLAGRPSLGSWVTYGLGSENANLPGFVVMKDVPSCHGSRWPRNWGAGFMPAVYQGTQLESGLEPIANLQTPASVGPARQLGKLDYLGLLNRRHLLSHADQSELDARIQSYELAFRMQAEAPEAVDLTRETTATLALYGLDNPTTDNIGRLCLLARRLVERGVRFVQIYCGAGSKWDAHSDIEANHSQTCGAMDRPVAGLLKDLKSRGSTRPNARRLGRRVRPHAHVREGRRSRP